MTAIERSAEDYIDAEEAVMSRLLERAGIGVDSPTSQGLRDFQMRFELEIEDFGFET